jgi:endonuclease YncB( thermonuclease family)
MDTPENTTKNEFFGAEATAKNKELVEGKSVLLVKDVSETDRYDRLLRYVFVGDIFVNYELVKQGYANPATYPPDVACVETFLQAEREVREDGLGLWGAAVISQPEPTSQPVATAPTFASGSVAITRIFYDGDVPQVESDEYAEITNNGSTTVNLSGWRLNAGAPGQDFRFPSFDLKPEQSCRVYTNEDHPESCGFSFRSGQPVWSNKGDCGYLYNEKSELVSEKCY